MTLQPDKCHFLHRELMYLRHEINDKGVRPDLATIEVVERFPTPKTRTKIEQFFGLVGYYRRFIQDMARIAKPLTRLRKRVRLGHTSAEII